MFSVELALFKERLLFKSFVIYLGIYFLLLLSQFAFGNEQAPVFFFPGLAMLLGSPFWLVFLDNGKIDAYRRLLPSLPLGRMNIFLSHLQLRFLLWILGVLLAYALTFIASLFLPIERDLSLLLYGVGISFVIFALMNLSLQFSPTLGIGYIGGITGLSMGMLFSVNAQLMDLMKNLIKSQNLWGIGFFGICFATGFFLTVFNGVLYLWRRP